MTSEMIVEKISELKDLKRMKAELDEMIVAAEDELKAEMTARKLNEATFGGFKIIWNPVVRQRVDTTALQKAEPELAQRFLVASVSRPFKIF